MGLNAEIIRPQFRPGSIAEELPAKALFGAKGFGSQQKSQSFGGYAKGCLAGGASLPETGPTWQAMRLSRNRNWGQPITISYLKELSIKVAGETNWSGIYVGDISQPRGGPMLSGHASHQIGLDADIWLLPKGEKTLTQKEREKISSISMRRAAGAYTNKNWTKDHETVLKIASKDPRTARIFLFPGAKVAMCKSATGNRSWLRKIRPWYGHHYHFHVRLKCPKGQAGCIDQAPPPSGDGCKEAQGWVDRILNPPPPDPDYVPRKPKPALKLSNLPNECESVLSSQ
ncbi:MAG: penicillin-insensitive murein endopeptidase [Planktomarina sp.]|nr:penicillin-insensitive murein endopeptidase [Planktomarina sp.]